MSIKKAFGSALKKARIQKGLPQEDFAIVSSRTYISYLERGIKSPTLEKLDSIAKHLDIHPVSLLAFAYLEIHNKKHPRRLISKITQDLEYMMERKIGD